MILLVGVLAGSSAAAQTPRETLSIGVLSLFHPTSLEISPVAGDVLTIQACGQTLLVEGAERATVRLVRGQLWLEDGGTSSACDEFTATGRTTGSFALEVPGKLRRRYRGALTLTVRQIHPRQIQPETTIAAMVAMDLETAVASAVEAESPPNAPQAALEAQAIVTRSFYLAQPHRHECSDFCDTTHCQFLREPPSNGAPASVAAASTRGLVLTYRGKIVQAYFSARCGGQTRSLEEGRRGADQYPFFAVDCAWCLRHRTAVARSGADICREPRVTSGYGTSSSHKVGLCQEGAADMAKSGANARDILAHYYPNTAVANFRK